MATKTEVTYTTNLYLETCCTCGVPFGIPHELYVSLRKSGNSFYCPNGHSQIYTAKKNTEEKLAEAQAQLAKEREVREWLDGERKHLAGELKVARNSLRATKAAHTRTKNRIAKGVCPCCNRQFLNLHRHMETEHPDYTEENERD